MKTIYVVYGSTGEYSDRREWLVKAFTSELSAQQLVLDATKRAKELQATRVSEYKLTPEDGASEYDPKIKMDYTGTSYYYSKVELED